MSKPLRTIVATALTLLGAWLLVGCFPWPGSFQRPESEGKPRPETLIGPASSFKPLRMGASTPDDVRALLGPPYLQSPDGRRVTYSYQIVASYLVMPFCFTADPQLAPRFLQLEFDQTGRLAAYHVTKQPPTDDQRPLRAPPRLVPRRYPVSPQPTSGSTND